MSIINLKDRVSLSNSDVQAINCALPLVSYAITDTPEQAMLNTLNCESAAVKLSKHNMVMTANEYRVVYIAIGIALDILSGAPLDYLEDFDLDPNWKAELSKNFFAYNRLYPQFEKLMDRFRK